MAATVGRNGTVRDGTTTITLVDSYVLNQTIETADISSYGSSFRDHVQTLKVWNGTFNATLDRSDAKQAEYLGAFESTGSGQPLGNIDLRLYTSNSNYYSGNSLLTAANINSAVGDKVSVSFSFTGNGALSYS